MKTRVLTILAFVILVPTPSIYAPPSVNPDWQGYPYCPGGCSNEYLKTEWAKYYEIKGTEWMEQKKQEMFSAYENGTLDKWIDSDPSRANQNVYAHYFYKGEIPNTDGKYVDQIFFERDLDHIGDQLKDGYVPLGDGFSINLVFVIILISAIVVGIVTAAVIVYKKRKKQRLE